VSIRDLIARRRDVTQYIAEDPWTITVYRKGLSGEAESTFSFTGRIAPGLFRVSVSERVPAILVGETGVTRQGWCIVAPYSTPVLKTRDEVKAVQGDITRLFRCINCTRYPYKIEVILEDLQ